MTSVKPWSAVALVALCWICVPGPGPCLAQDSPGEASRKVITRVVPDYPPIARHNGIGGNVRVEVIVAPNGTVRSLEIKGGHPVLVQAAADAVRKWKWVPGTHETTEPVTVKFDP
jgi:protein TonB